MGTTAAVAALVATVADVDGRVGSLEAELEAVTHAIGRLSRGEPLEGLPPGRAPPLVMWQCRGCGTRLGYEDTEQDAILIKYKDVYVTAVLGPGGWLETVCRTCGRRNRAEQQAPAAPGTTLQEWLGRHREDVPPPGPDWGDPLG